ncbi:hypothetical protein GCM10022253_19480 [Sphingomonas endophytica]|uniref:Head-tail adaptor n=1 Tax=Sphingomonas endophytica TaxID=869719 RepID=A0ABR6NAV1_9SPHN|nr:head-tail adaptor [Sphingomonas endophytica]
MTIAAGRLRFRVALLAPDTIENGRGGRMPSPGSDGWKAVADLWADVIALRGDEAVRQSIERPVQLWRVEVRMRRDVTTHHRLRWGAIVMDIKSVAPNDAGDGLVMTCESGANGK